MSVAALPSNMPYNLYYYLTLIKRRLDDRSKPGTNMRIMSEHILTPNTSTFCKEQNINVSHVISASLFEGLRRMML